MKKCSHCRVEKPDEDFALKSRKTGRRTSICKPCYKLYQRKHYKENKEQYYARNQRQREKARKVLADFKSVGCKYCDEQERVALDCHHTKGDGSNERRVGKLANTGQTKQLKKELKKCEVVCANCHRKLHAGLLGA